MSNQITKWDYFKKVLDFVEIDEELAAFGREGWELVSIQCVDSVFGNMLCTFKRPLINQEENNKQA